MFRQSIPLKTLYMGQLQKKSSPPCIEWRGIQLKYNIGSIWSYLMHHTISQVIDSFGINSNTYKKFQNTYMINWQRTMIEFRLSKQIVKLELRHFVTWCSKNSIQLYYERVWLVWSIIIFLVVKTNLLLPSKRSSSGSSIFNAKKYFFSSLNTLNPT